MVSVKTGPLRVRKSASTSAAVVGYLNKGSYVTLHTKSGSWWKVEYADGKYGYCHSDYIKTVESSVAKVATKGSPLRVRSGAGTSYSQITTLPKGEQVVVLSKSNGWSRILYNGTKTGYVSSTYLSSGSTYQAISLSVPHYMQNDKRWANTTLGTSGKTMADIGCTTSSLAMTESFRLGKTIYPDIMAKSLQYTPSGSLYWPSNYVGVTAKLDLAAIYALLKEGKPVVIGFATSAGRQHWAVIYGFSGGNTLTESGFLIKDPGNASRTTLSQLREKYPNFYKYVYYK